MKQVLFFANFPKTEAIENFAQNRLARVFGKFRKTQIESSEMRFQVENFPGHPGRNLFTCEVLVRSNLLSKPLFIKKTSENLYNSIVEVANTLREQLSKVHSRVVDHHSYRVRPIPVELG